MKAVICYNLHVVMTARITEVPTICKGQVGSGFNPLGLLLHGVGKTPAQCFPFSEKGKFIKILDFIWNLKNKTKQNNPRFSPLQEDSWPYWTKK